MSIAISKNIKNYSNLKFYLRIYKIIFICPCKFGVLIECDEIKKKTVLTFDTFPFIFIIFSSVLMSSVKNHHFVNLPYLSTRFITIVSVIVMFVNIITKQPDFTMHHN